MEMAGNLFGPLKEILASVTTATTIGSGSSIVPSNSSAWVDQKSNDDDVQCSVGDTRFISEGHRGWIQQWRKPHFSVIEFIR
jgi:hypothetical protein